MDQPKTFGARVRGLRARLNALLPEKAQVSCAEVDRLAGLVRGHTWQIEEGAAALERGDETPWRGAATNPKADTARALAKFFGCTVGHLLDEEPGAPPTDDAMLDAYGKANGAPPARASTSRARPAA